MTTPPARQAASPDPLARVLEVGLIATVLLAPLPFGAVTPSGRLALELGAFLLGLLWLARSLRRGNRLPPVATTVGMVGLLLLGGLQALPLNGSLISWISPRSVEIRAASRASDAILEAERRFLEVDPREVDPPPSLSLDPDRTASAVRTGCALAVLLLVGVSVAHSCGMRAVTYALLVSAAGQALYGILVLASGHDMIWTIPKRHYLNSATGTYVNKNHFAGFLAAALPCGLALILSQTRSRPDVEGIRARVVARFSTEGTRPLLLGLLLLLGIAGLLLSLSRAGTALGAAALAVTALATGRRGLRSRIVVGLLVLALAAVPLFQIGAERLALRYAQASEDLTASGGRAVVWSDTLRMAADFPLVGCGFGTFAAAYPLYRSPDVRLFFDHAHNDAVQALAEGGFLGATFLLLILGPLLRRMVGALTGSGGTLAVGVAAGLAAFLLHALVDFNFRIPANAAVAAILAGALLGLPWKTRS